jgi:hypothetical protein
MFPEHLADPAGVVHGTIVAVKDPGFVEGCLALDALVHRIDAEIAALREGPQHIAFGVFGEHRLRGLFLLASDAVARLSAFCGIAFSFLP